MWLVAEFCSICFCVAVVVKRFQSINDFDLFEFVSVNNAIFLLLELDAIDRFRLVESFDFSHSRQVKDSFITFLSPQ